MYNKMNYREKYIDLLQPGAEYKIQQHLANGWYIQDQGLTLVIMRKYVIVEV